MSDEDIQIRIKKEGNHQLVESWGSTQIQVIEHRFTWTINNFNSAQKYFDNLSSPTFLIGDNKNKLEWYLHLELNRNSEDSNKPLLLTLISKSKEYMKLEYHFGIVNAKGKDITLITPTVMNGNRRSNEFISLANLLNKENEYLSEDNLIIFCQINAAVDSYVSGIFSTPQSNLVEDFESLLANQYLSNVTLIANSGKEFPAHRVILIARSPVFKAQFQQMEESKNIQFPMNMNEEHLYEMLRYIYTGKITKLKQLAGPLLTISEQFKMADLKIECEKALLESLSFENATRILVLSDTCNATTLKTRATEFIASNASNITNTPAYESMIQAHPHLNKEIFSALLNMHTD